MDLGAQHRRYLHAGLDLLADVLLLRDGLNAAAQLKRLHLCGELTARAVKVGDAAQAEPLAQLSPPMRSSAPVRHSIASAEVFSSASSTPSTIWEKGSSAAALQMVPLSER